MKKGICRFFPASSEVDLHTVFIAKFLVESNQHILYLRDELNMI